MKSVLIALFTVINVAFGQSGNTYLFVGTYTNAQPDKGIYIYEFNPKNGTLKLVSSGENMTNPSYLTLSPSGNFIYACSDTKMVGAGSVSSFAFDSISGKLSFINKQDCGGENPVYVSTSENNKFVISANYTGGSVSVFSVNPNGSINAPEQLIAFDGNGPNPSRQEKSHVHAAVFSPDFQFAFFPDLGSDKIRVFNVDETADKPLIQLENADFTTVPGSGPRHFIFHPNKKFAYCIEELSGTVSAYRYQNGSLDSIQRIASYAQPQEEYNSADLHISPDGLFLYASNRLGENTISIFSIDQENGTLKLLNHQKTYGAIPRSFVIDPSGNFLLVANQVSNTIVVFKRDSKTGMLTRTGKPVKVQSPSCLKMRSYGG